MPPTESSRASEFATAVGTEAHETRRVVSRQKADATRAKRRALAAFVANKHWC